MTLKIAGTNVVNENLSFVLGSATPGSPVTGLIRYNSVTSNFEVYDGTIWVTIADFPGIPTAWSWGANSYGELGHSNLTNRSSPVSIPNIIDWIQVSAGGSHTLAVRGNGTAWAWGRNNFGKLGDNTTTNRSSPVQVVGGFTDWVQVSAGTNHSAGIRANGTAWGWGNNDQGRLGDNTTSSRLSPVSVVGGFTDWVQVAAGYAHTAGLRSNGSAWGWGYGTIGQIGDNTATNRSSPVSVVGGFTDWVQISVCPSFSFFTVAIRANGTAWAWGENGFGQLGDNSLTNRNSPVSTLGGFTDWIQVAAGQSTTLGLRANGTLWGWGSNVEGGIGDGSANTFTTSPVSTIGGFTDWVQVSSGGINTVAIRANGTAWGWGYNINGRLGTGDTTNRSSPVSVVGGFTDWVQISAGYSHTVALRAI